MLVERKMGACVLRRCPNAPKPNVSNIQKNILLKANTEARDDQESDDIDRDQCLFNEHFDDSLDGDASISCSCGYADGVYFNCVYAGTVDIP